MNTIRGVSKKILKEAEKNGGRFPWAYVIEHLPEGDSLLSTDAIVTLETEEGGSFDFELRPKR